MSKEQKLGKTGKEQRRLNEILKAQSSIRGYTPVSVATSPAVSLASNEGIGMVTLPIGAIKTDLIKNVAFAVFSILVLIILAKTGFGLDHFSKVVKF